MDRPLLGEDQVWRVPLSLRDWGLRRGGGVQWQDGTAPGQPGGICAVTRRGAGATLHPDHLFGFMLSTCLTFLILRCPLFSPFWVLHCSPFWFDVVHVFHLFGLKCPRFSPFWFHVVPAFHLFGFALSTFFTLFTFIAFSHFNGCPVGVPPPLVCFTSWYA
jgi:hypothetical protein